MSISLMFEPSWAMQVSVDAKIFSFLMVANVRLGCIDKLDERGRIDQ
jgi:hypothetical protein